MTGRERNQITARQETRASDNERKERVERTSVLGALTDSQLPLDPLHVAVSVLGLDGVTASHQVHELLTQDAVLEGEGNS